MTLADVWALILAARCSLVSKGSGERKEGIRVAEKAGIPIPGRIRGFDLMESAFMTGPSGTVTG